jgi:hypothetical protein
MDEEEKRARNKRASVILTILLGFIALVWLFFTLVSMPTTVVSDDTFFTEEQRQEMREELEKQGLPVSLKDAWEKEQPESYGR